MARKPVTTTTTLKAEVIDADPEWAAQRNVAPTYEFSNGRNFTRRESPGRAYPWKEGS